MTIMNNLIIQYILDAYLNFKISCYYLYKSISSTEFYREIYENYDGYGIRYNVILSFFAAFMATIILNNYGSNFAKYILNKDNAASSLDYIINQFPEINYNGSEIIVANKEPIFITNTHGDRIILIDKLNKIDNAQKRNIPIILYSTKMVVQYNAQDHSSFELEYRKFLGNEALKLNRSNIKDILISYSKKYTKIISFIIFPLLIFMLLFIHLFNELITVCILYVMFNLFANKSSIKTCIRLALFSDGVSFLCQPVITLLFPGLASIIWIIKIWANFLMIFSITKMTKMKKNKDKIYF